MDLVIAILLSISISIFKIIHNPNSTIQTTIVDNSGTVIETTVKETNLVVGNNLMLRREPRAYHKILDEMGLK